MCEQSPWQTGPASDTITALNRDQVFDVVVVGGGFTGLSIAYHLAKLKGAEGIALVEAAEIGSGASGRNSGMIGPGIWGTYDRMEKKFGPDMAQAMFAHTESAVRIAIDWIQAEPLPCDLVVGKQIKVAITEAHQEKLAREVSALQRAGFAIRGLEKRELQHHIRTDRYRYGLEYAQSATVNPLALAQALKHQLIAMGVQVFEHTPVTHIQSHTQQLMIKTPKASLCAKNLFIAANGFMPAMGILKNRVFPISTHLLRTQPLTNTELASLGINSHCAFIDTRRIFNFFRLTPDNRLVFGGGKPVLNPANSNGRFEHHTDKCAGQVLHRELLDVFPTLADVPIETLWRGTMGFTIDNLPILGATADPRIFLAGAWCGHGLALSLANGKHIAQAWINNEPMTSMPWHRASAPLMPPGALLAPSLAAYISTLSLADRWDLFKGGSAGGAPHQTQVVGK
ncbi:NAD(P)/FAD-dependent oxidoreductase [Cellvibrio japonicus]|uniref:FAD binding domain protein n=1 Tax=Cellvibrio japonicus (strain Ueda107) TaxID=498211 RepID=B3PI09_CELJU|nr:FAD-binding oxidoreductase [Cellvibrio japonicus]ACE82798.1 FAD binding domain protein [Cellvibrio japonicus Ueda107]QEI13941.1 FAD-binding oxidoreductase [Cellvibrio japonicus]QEI17515.1 FAD-binding oxidoreductase [Cellvibrio japonicus]QEI21091.1 FAD-binding oxidoreductase [Cellvibrio japonicus]